mgnify:FL=1
MSGTSSRQGDHPRSRGVYPTSPGRILRRRGSSPLARGLPDDVREGEIGLGIIPARAGFTTALRESRTRGKDHPRSRGVYPKKCAAHSLYPGSSPLARGLPDPVHQGVCELRIIPARAGFTEKGTSIRMGAPDHPRSRGVYDREGALRVLEPGSSPLARGLRFQCREEHSGYRIIPARAGFTASSM